MATIQEAINAAFQHHRAGRFADAEKIYHQILAADERCHTALHLLGALYLQTKNADQAIVFLQRAVQASPNDVESLNHLGGAYQAAGCWRESLSVLRRAVDLAPDNAKLHFDLGNSLKAAGDTTEAIRSFREAVRLRPDFLQALNNLGTTLNNCGEYSAAISNFREALRLKPDYANAHNGLGSALLDSGNTAEAIAALKQATLLRPSEAKFHCNLGAAHKAHGNPDAALSEYQNALRLQPDLPEARRNLANLFISQQMPDKAIAELNTALAQRPDDAELLIALGDAWRDLEDHEQALNCWNKAAEHNPSNSWLPLKGAFLCSPVVDSTETITEFRARLDEALQAHAGQPIELSDAESCVIEPPFNSLYHGLDDRTIRENIAALYAPSFSQGSALRQQQADASERIRVGFVVTNGHEGIFCRCMAGILDRLSRADFDVWVMAPPVAQKMISSAITNPDTSFLSLPERLHRMLAPIRNAAPDILYHWECGTDVLNYLLPFEKLAPVQCTGWGLPVTSGIPAMDYYLSSQLVEPEGASSHYTETLLCAPTLLTWQEPICVEATADRKDLGFDNSEHLYVCAQNIRKLHPEFDSILREILLRDNGARLILMKDKNAALTERLQHRLSRSLGPCFSRVIWHSRVSLPEYLQLLSVCDVALDPLHFGAGITAYENFACGLPLITLPTKFRRGRFVAGCYRRMEFTECIAADRDDYVQKAVETASDSTLRQFRSTTIKQRSEVLFRDLQAVREFENCLHQMWNNKG